MRRAGTSGPYLRASSGRFGGVDDAHRVIGEVRGFDHPGPRAGLEGGEDVLAVLLVLVAARLLGRVGPADLQAGGGEPLHRTDRVSRRQPLVRMRSRHPLACRLPWLGRFQSDPS
jgi:hypothetical protein